MTYFDDRKWSDRYIPDVIDILNDNAKYLLNIQIASSEKDMHESTDLSLTIASGDIAVRILREKKFDTFTIRSFRSNGTKTELQKIKDGYCKWYFFGWCKEEKLNEWIIIDLDLLRNSGLLDDFNTIMNKDKTTGFIAIPIKDLSFHKCIIANSKLT